MTGMEELEQFTREMEQLKDAMKRSRKVNLSVAPFRMGTDKETANKVLGEASEAREAAQWVRNCNPSSACCEYDCHDECEALENLADEIADCIQACCNLADRYGIDLQAAMVRCEERNFRRGRYGAETGIEVGE